MPHIIISLEQLCRHIWIVDVLQNPIADCALKILQDEKMPLSFCIFLVTATYTCVSTRIYIYAKYLPKV